MRRETSGDRSFGADDSSDMQIADVLPPDSEGKLEAAQGIINAAFRQKAAEMGGELQRLRMDAADKDSRIRSLESRLADCQDTLRDVRCQVLPWCQLCMHCGRECMRMFCA